MVQPISASTPVRAEVPERCIPKTTIARRRRSGSAELAPRTARIALDARR